MGRGINIQPKGKHIAYTAGTGALVFLDLVAYLLIRVIEANGGPKIVQDAKQGVNNSTFQQSSILSEDNGLVSLQSQIDLNAFTFELHTAYATPDEAIGLELI